MKSSRDRDGRPLGVGVAVGFVFVHMCQCLAHLHRALVLHGAVWACREYVAKYYSKYEFAGGEHETAFDSGFVSLLEGKILGMGGPPEGDQPGSIGAPFLGGPIDPLHIWPKAWVSTGTYLAGTHRELLSHKSGPSPRGPVSYTHLTLPTKA